MASERCWAVSLVCNHGVPMLVAHTCCELVEFGRMLIESGGELVELRMLRI